MIDIKIPSIGESINEVTIAEWLKKDGDYVEEDEVICELESEKASFELNAEKSGILHISVAAGEDAQVGQTVAQIDESAQAPAGDSPKEEETQAEEPSASEQPEAKEETTSEPEPPAAAGKGVIE